VNQPDLGSAGHHCPASFDQIRATGNRVIQSNQGQRDSTHIDGLGRIDQQVDARIAVGLARGAIL
jgi:hypothetical protein